MIYTIEQLIQNIDPKRNPKGKSPTGNVQFPGTQLGYTIGQMRDFIKLQKKSKGFDFQTEANLTTDFPITMPGNANVLLGISASTSIANIANLSDYSATLMINNEQIFEHKNLQFLSPWWNRKDEEYFPFPRPVSGKDDIKIAITAKANADLIFIDLYYI